MAKIYGDRWRIKSSLDEGGQAYVYIVEDISGVEPESVLKRVKNQERSDRFLTEIKALAQLHHPGIIRMIDFPRSMEEMGNQELFYVMPRAKEGNLEKNVAWFRESLDLTISLGITLASALADAHEAGVIHRDVKPRNILFFDKSPSAVLSDFGICLITDTTRATQDGEMVGPRGFIAPELEVGGLIEVSPSADLYSLGKVLYFAISGGVVVPRERHREPGYGHIFTRGARAEMFGRLLDQLICLEENRLRSSSAVVARLADIADFENKVRLPITERGNSLLDEMSRAESNFLSTEEFNLRVRERQANEHARFLSLWVDWAKGFLDTTIEAINARVGMRAKSDSAAWSSGLPFFGEALGVILGQTVSVIRASSPQREHMFWVLLCQQAQGPSTKQVATSRIKYVEPLYHIVPTYAQRGTKTGGYFTRTPIPKSAGAAKWGFAKAENVFFETVRPSEWAAKVELVSTMLSSAFESFLQTIGGSSAGTSMLDCVLAFSDVQSPIF